MPPQLQLPRIFLPSGVPTGDGASGYGDESTEQLSKIAVAYPEKPIVSALECCAVCSCRNQPTFLDKTVPK